MHDYSCISYISYINTEDYRGIYQINEILCQIVPMVTYSAVAGMGLGGAMSISDQQACGVTLTILLCHMVTL